MRTILKSIGLLVLGCSLLTGCAPAPASPGAAKLIVFEADSLMVPFAQVEKEFEAKYPDIPVEIQAHGSIQVIRHVTELGEDVDIVAVADYSLIPMLMYTTKTPDGKPFADWYIKPATNELVIAYSERSKYADEINAGNWFDVVSRPDVKFGLADPRMDAVGYRTLMLSVLANSYYHEDGLLRTWLGSSFSPPITSSTQNGVTTISVPEILEPSNEHMCLRGANMQLLALLESGDVDYTVDYKSVVLQHNLKYIELPPDINMVDPAFAESYGTVVVKLDFRRFKTVEPVFAGVPVGYGLAIPANARHRDAAIKFLEFLLGPDGQRIFAENSHRQLVPPECDNVGALPAELQSFFP